MIKHKISTKITLYFLLVAIVPMVVSTYIIASSASNQLLSAASKQQQSVADGLVYRVDSYLSTKISNLINISQLYSTNNSNSQNIDQALAVALNGDPDMQRIALVGSSGSDQVVFTRTGQSYDLKDESNTDAFKASNFPQLAGKPYVSSADYSSSHEPIITIATPVILSNYANHLNNLKSADFGVYQNTKSIQGTVIASYNMSGLWNSILSTRVGKGGYAYLVDGLGNLVAYPNSIFLEKNPKIQNVKAFTNFIKGDLSTNRTISETGQPVISTPRVVSKSGWGVIVEEPVNDIYSSVYSYAKLATIIGVSADIIVIILSIYFGLQLTDPIRKLTQGAKLLGDGDFDHKIEIHTKDELQELAETFNSMASSIKKLVGDLKGNNIILKLEESKLNNIIKSVSDGVIALNAKGEIVMSNPPAAKLIHKTPEQIIGRKISDLFALQFDDKPFVLSLDKTGIYQYNELILPHHDSMSYLNIVVSVINHQQDDIAAIITINDLTKSRELDFMKLDFVAIAAHELRTPLTVVRGYLDLINTEAITRMSLSGIENLQKAMQGADQLRDLINKLLNIARIERGEMEIFVEKLNISKIIRESVRQHQSTSILKEQTIELKTQNDKDIYVPADPSSLNEVLNNLLGNAIKYTSKGGEIKVRVSSTIDVVRVEVQDNGPGVPENLRAKLFTKFYRAERSLIAGTRGTGLGLYISKTIIELLHGTIGITDDSDHGSTFYFTLPIYQADKDDKLILKEKPLGGIHGWFKKRRTS
jgi:PAS domain S-box-containing protein